LSFDRQTQQAGQEKCKKFRIFLFDFAENVLLPCSVASANPLRNIFLCFLGPRRNKQDFQIFILPSSLASVKFKFLAKMVPRRAQDNLGILTTQAENNETFNKPVTTLVLSIITAAFIIFGTS